MTEPYPWDDVFNGDAPDAPPEPEPKRHAWGRKVHHNDPAKTACGLYTDGPVGPIGPPVDATCLDCLAALAPAIADDESATDPVVDAAAEAEAAAPAVGAPDGATETGLVSYESAVSTTDVAAMLDALADDTQRRTLVGRGRDATVHAVRTRAGARAEHRPEKIVDATDLRAEIVGAADDAETLAALASIFAEGAKEARQIGGELLDELPKRGGKARASAKVGDGHGYELTLKRARTSALSVDHDAVDDVLVAWLLKVAEVEQRLAVEEGKADDGPLALKTLPAKLYASGLRDGIAMLRGILSSSPDYKSTELDRIRTTLEDRNEDDLAKRLRDAYAKVEKGEPRVTLERKPLPNPKKDEEASA